jgi:hypothetical protein
MHRLILVLGVVAVMSIGGRLGGGQVSVAQAAIPQPIYFWTNVAAEISAPGQSLQPEVIRPARIFLFADGSWDIEQLHWTGWGSSVAHAKGISSSSNGIPNLAQGKRIKTPGQVTLSSPGRFNGHEVYRCFALTVPPPATRMHLCLTVTGGGTYFSSTTTTTPTTTPPVTSPPISAVRILSANGRTCKRADWTPGQPAVDRSAYGPSCPVTPRLRRWLQTHPEGGSGGSGPLPPPNVIGLEAICRCQNSPPTKFRLGANNGSVASVMELTYGTVTFVVLHTKLGWLVDDTYCTHGIRATTSIYHLPFAGCPQSPIQSSAIR